jgi:hypothetical protein
MSKTVIRNGEAEQPKAADVSAGLTLEELQRIAPLADCRPMLRRRFVGRAF